MTGRGILSGLAGLWVCLLGASATASDLTVFAAASLKTVLDDIKADWRNETGGDLTLVFAGTATLAKQIDAGAPADIVLSANVDWMDWLSERGRIDPDSRIDVAGNRLIVISFEQIDFALTQPAAWDAALGQGRLAMALVGAVPAGLYGKAALMQLGLWSDLSDRVAQTDNVRAALALVALGEAPLGIVYQTDALVEPTVHIAATFPPDSHPPIRYPAAAVVGADASADAFLDFLTGTGAQARFETHGFLPLDHLP